MKSIADLVYYTHSIYSHVTCVPLLFWFALYIFISFVVVYRWSAPQYLRLRFPKLEKSKILNCETCFTFWLCLLISTNLLTAITAYLISNFYEKD